MTLSTRVQKRCERCGVVSFVRPRVRRCHERRFGRGSYACWGALDRVVAPKRPKPVATPKEAIVREKKRPQDIAQAKLEVVRKKITEKTSALRKLATAIAKLERLASRYAKRASLTDAEIEATRQKRLDAVARRKSARSRRGMSLTGVRGEP